MTPNLVTHYKAAVEQVYGVTPYVPESYNGRFLAVEIELIDHRINDRHYAKSQAIMWRPWVEKMGLTHLPLNVFLGIAAKTRYNKLLSMPSVELVLDHETELQTYGLMFEREFAKWYMEQLLYKIGVKDEAQALDVYLDGYTNENLLYKWLDYCEVYGRDRLKRSIIHQFCDYWGIKQVCADYFQLACRYVADMLTTYKKLAAKLDKLDWRSRNYKVLSQIVDKLSSELDQLKMGSLL